MSDNKKQDDEYYFPDEDSNVFDDEHGQEEFSTEDSAPNVEQVGSMKSSLVSGLKHFVENNKRPVMVGCGAVLVLIVCKIFFFGGSSSVQHKMPAVNTNKKQVTAPIVLPKRVEASDFVKSDSVSSSQVNKVKSQANSNRVQLTNLESRMAKIGNTQVSTSADMHQISEQVESIGSNVQQLVAQVKLLQEKQKKMEAKKIAKKLNYVRYHISAIETNRAWIKGSNGLTASITLGDHIPHYGVVKNIDVDNGIIYMSSGDNLVYPKNDLK